MEKNVANNLMALSNAFNRRMPTAFNALDSIDKYLDEDIFLSVRDTERHVLTHIDDKHELRFTKMLFCRGLNAIYTWKWHKKIYEIDKDLESLLIEQYIGDMIMEPSILKKLPFNGMCIHMSTYEDIYVIITVDYIRAAWASIIKDQYKSGLGDNDKALYFHIYRADKLSKLEDGDDEDMMTMLPVILSIPLIDNKTILECIDTISFKANSVSEKEDIKTYMMQVLNVLMYILSANADIRKRSINQSTLNKKHKRYKKQLQGLEIFEVGFVLGETIRMNKNISKRESDPFETRTGATTSKRPHVRCGHWQHYWTGKRSDPSQRRRVLKWIHPCLVNPVAKEAVDVYIHPVKK